MTEDQALALITRLVGGDQRMRLLPFEFGWLAKRELAPKANPRRPEGLRIGQGCWIIDRDGTVTAQSSLSTRILMRQYSEARREGRTTGRQVWPQTGPTDRT